MDAEILERVDKWPKRSSNFELLRIVSMILIIAYHYCIHGNRGEIFSSDNCNNQIVAIILGSWGLLGVDCFVFISAYFLIHTSKFSSKKLTKIILQTIFYSISIVFFLHLTGNTQIGMKDLIKSIFSPFFGMYWYITVYCMLYVIFPFLNKIIYNMNSKYLLKFLIILTLFVPIYRTIFSSIAIGDFIFFIYIW